MTQLDNILDDVGLPTPPGEGATESVSHEQALYEEHTARVQAEAEAGAAQRRLLVANQQVAEYLGQKAEDVRALAGAAEALGRDAGRESPASPATLAARCGELREALDSAAADLGTTAGHFFAECEATKRGLDRMGEPGMSPKRLRESGGFDDEEAENEDGEEGAGPTRRSDAQAKDAISEDEEGGPQPGARTTTGQGRRSYDAMCERAKHIPLRLDGEERRLLRLLEAALSVSEYTDKVDILSWRSKTGRVEAQVRDLCAILCGLVVAQDFKRGRDLLARRDFSALADFFRDTFEVGRRHKIQNPDRMRDGYGKLMYALMDASEPVIQELLEFNCVRPLRTVHTLLEAAGGLALLDDPLIEVATAEISAVGVPRSEVQRRIKAKERARETLARRHRSATLPEDDILRCLYSIADNAAYLRFNRDPVDRVLGYLESHFSPTLSPGAPADASLAIQGGMEGSRLTHSHARQHAYVAQSLTLWREIAHEMFALWHAADADLLAPRPGYRLQNTGQGLHRVQPAPAVAARMAAILQRCQSRLGGGWVGSSVVHLGDHNVPNALTFIDKYNQVPRILGPLVLVLDALPGLCRGDAGIAAYVTSLYGSPRAAQQAILRDFFRHAFDGSGADNFFDAGSCIDGRLTSAWNWCSKLEKKRYYPLFLLAGFTGFDGEFR